MSALLVAAAPLFVPQAASGGVNQWTSIGFDDAIIDPFVAHPTASRVIYAAVDGVLMKTSDGGSHWVEVTLPQPGASDYLLAIDPAMSSTVYVTRFNTYLYKSVDSGAHWTAAGTFPYISALATAPSQTSTLYLGGLGVQRSTDGGASWTDVGSGLPLESVSALAVNPTSANIVYAATFGSKVFKSTNGGEHWRQLPIALPYETEIERFAIDPLKPSTIYAVYAGNWDPRGAGVVKSSDGGESWTAPHPLLGDWGTSLAIDPVDTSRIYVGTSAGVFQSTDGAESWATLDDGLSEPYVLDLAIDRTGTVLRAATVNGLFEYRFPAAISDLVAVIEYYHARFGHYFITALPDEIAKLDNGEIDGWTSTGLQFNAHSAAASGTSPVCRFHSTAFGSKSSHFYSPFASECAKLRSDARWTLESDAVFHVAAAGTDGSCPAGNAPVYRLYNNGQGGAPNHRYTTDFGVRAQMIAQGWVPEGLGADAVQMCAPL